MKRRYNGKGYMALLRRRARSSGSARKKLGKIAARYRARMINPKHPPTRMVNKPCVMDPESKALFSKITKTASGKKVARLFGKFWKIKCPPSVRIVSSLPGSAKQPISLMGMGETTAVYLSSGNKGERGKRTRTVKGRWHVASDKTGKHVILLSERNKKISGPLKSVGFAPETHYVPPPDIEKIAPEIEKAGAHWRHKHGERDGAAIPLAELKWPVVYADRNGKVDENSNFLYGSTKHGKVSTWMFH